MLFDFLVTKILVFRIVSKVFPDLETIMFNVFFSFKTENFLSVKLSINKKFFLLFCEENYK